MEENKDIKKFSNTITRAVTPIELYSSVLLIYGHDNARHEDERSLITVTDTITRVLWTTQN